MSARDQEVCDACAAAGQITCTHLDDTDAAIDAINQRYPGEDQAGTRVRAAVHVVRDQQDPDQQQQGGRS